MVNEVQRICPGKGHRCMSFMADVADDPHRMCDRCRGLTCSASRRCNECSHLEGDSLRRYVALLDRRQKKKAQRRAAAARNKTAKSLSVSSISSSPLSSPPSFCPSESVGGDMLVNV